MNPISQRIAVTVTVCLAPFLALCLGSFAKASEVSSAPVQRAESLPAPPPEASATNALSLAQLEQMALSFNPSLARAAAIVRAQSGKAYQAGLLPNPSVGYEGQQLGSGGQAEQQGVLFSQEIIRGGKLRLDRGVAQRDVAIAQQEFAAQRLRVLTDVRIAYYQVLLAQRQIDLMANLLRIGQEGEQVVDELFRAKVVGQADVLQAELEVENAKILAENAHNRHDAAWRSLAAVVGNPALPPQALAGDALAPPLDLKYDDVLAQIRGMSPELSAAAIEVERARVVFERARAEPIPNVTMQGLVNVIDNGIGGRPDGGLAVTVPVPIFNRNQGSIMRAQQEIIAARNALAQMELSLQNRLAPTFGNRPVNRILCGVIA